MTYFDPLYVRHCADQYGWREIHSAQQEMLRFEWGRPSYSGGSATGTCFKRSSKIHACTLIAATRDAPIRPKTMRARVVGRLRAQLVELLNILSLEPALVAKT
ncbi:hypothetical protein CYMTET_24900 [Cymbomonas tetramitiformis]|uniref:Uncharacterized protein n=1 Tax=Cymbomonas tetramitiformis TaxID=36881 RepID=A0AAE0FWE5_9CHLO|nr:hypothetical protein CYMTET_24900 [Cymbomonas tetramitiformis]